MQLVMLSHMQIISPVYRILFNAQIVPDISDSNERILLLLGGVVVSK